jgi:uncharacterized protein (TIGR03032 family)
MLLASRYELTMFTRDDVLARTYDPTAPDRYNGLYIPRWSHHVPELNIHEIGFGTDDVWLTNTRFSCLATLSDSQSFEPRWRPRFISALVPEDRCHLNGLAMRDGKPDLVTVFAPSDIVCGWRERKRSGGAIIHVDSGDFVIEGLCMPHSPRWHRDAIWVLNSGAGELLTVDSSGRAKCVCRLSGYARGLTFVGECAVVGLSQVRERHIFDDFPLAERHRELACGVVVVDTHTGRRIGQLTMSGAVTEVFEVRFVPGLTRLNLLRSDSQEAHSAVVFDEVRYWLRPEDERRDTGD